MGGSGRNKVLPKEEKPCSRYSNPQLWRDIKKIDLLPEEQEVGSPQQELQHLDHKRDEPTKIWALKITRKTIELQGKRDPLLKGSYIVSLALKFSANTRIGKASRTQVKETHLLLLGCLPERQENAENLPVDRKTVRCYFCSRIYLVCAHARGCHLGTLTLAY